MPENSNDWCRKIIQSVVALNAIGMAWVAPPALSAGPEAFLDCPSTFAVGDVVTCKGGNFSPNAVVDIKLHDSATNQSYTTRIVVSQEGRITHAVHASIESAITLDVLSADKSLLAQSRMIAVRN
ncbi:MAG: hypothetical protein JNJ44_04085 [Zoogloeaceae bacterium]|nr:hypothetical protein [Zoogloeaceae bacterium]